MNLSLTEDSTNALVSIIIPTYNRVWGLPLAIRSALDQSHELCEIIVIDDCSDDTTADIVAAFADSRLSYFRQPNHMGMVKNWGTGLQFAKGEFIVFLADDDQLRPNFVMNRLRSMRDGPPGVIVAFSQYDVRDRNGMLLAVQNQDQNKTIRLEGRELLQAALARRWFIGASMYGKKAVLQVWDSIAHDDLVLDLGLNVRLAVAGLGSGIFIGESDFIMTSHPDQNSLAKREQVFQQTSTTLARILQEGLPARYSSMIKQELASWHVVWGRSLARQGLMAEARSHFRQALRSYPTLLWAWKQLALSWLCPGRLKNAELRRESLE